MAKKTIRQKHPLLRNGSTRVGRLVAALAPESFKLDDRSIQDLLVVAHRYAGLLHFFNENDRPDGDWTCFWETETLTYLAVLSALPTDELRKKYDDLDFRLGELLEDRRKPDAGKTKKQEENDLFRALIGHILEMAKGLETSYRNLAGIDHPMKTFLERLIERNLAPPKIDQEELVSAIRELLALHKGADDLLHKRPDDYALFYGSARWGLPDAARFSVVKADADATRERLRGIFIRFLNAFLVLKSRAQADFDAELRRAERPEIEEYRIMQPHVALFIAFLRLFHHAQNSLNSLVKKQLDFYYEQVLGLHRRPAVPDSVFLILELAKNFDPQEVQKGTLLFGGKDKKTGRPLMFAATETQVISQAKVVETKSFYLPSSPYALVGDFSEKLESNPKTVLENPDLLAKEHSRTFSDNGKLEENERLEESELGFVIASPQLLLQEGKRLIEIKMAGITSAIKTELLEVRLSGKEGWSKASLKAETANLGGFDQVVPLPSLEAASFQISPLLPTGFSIKIFLPKDFPAVEPLPAGSMTTRPAVKITLKEGQLERVKDFKKLISATGEKAFSISVRAEGVSKNLTLQTDQGVFNGTQQVFPFGPTASIGARFYVGFAEAFLKKLDSVILKPNWVPASDEIRKVSVQILKNANFNETVSPELVPDGVERSLRPRISTAPNALELRPFIGFGGRINWWQNPIWNPVLDFPSIATEAPAVQKAGLHFSDESILVDLTDILPVRDGEPTYAFEKYEPSVRRGFLRMILEEGFGHADFAERLAIAAMKVNFELEHPPVSPAKKTELPSPPYTPTFNSIELDYISKNQMMLDDLDEFIYLHPFGGHEKAKKVKIELKEWSAFAASTLFKDFLSTKKEGESRGHFYIGLEKLTPKSTLSLLFQTKEGSELDADQNPPSIVWAVLSKENEWLDLRADQIEDSTGGLTRGGILKLTIPAELSSEGCTILSPDLHWLRAMAVETSESSTLALPDISFLKAQVIEARLQLDEQTTDGPAHLAEGLPESTISKLAESRSAIKKIEQPFPTFGGRLPETAGMNFYVRISERLRHRDRAVTVWDYEHLLLEKFTDLAAAKAIGHTQYSAFPASELAPGRVTVAVVPDLKKRVGTPREQPRYPKGDLDTMAAFLAERANLFLQKEGKTMPLAVANAQFEPIEVAGIVHLLRGKDVSFYEIKLSEDLQNFFSPWILDEKAAPEFGKTIRRSAVIRFIEELDYVDHLENPADFKIGGSTVEEIRPAAAHGILCSGKHSISVLEFSTHS